MTGFERIDLTTLVPPLKPCNKCRRPRTPADVHPQQEYRCRICTPIQRGHNTSPETRTAKYRVFQTVRACQRCGQKWKRAQPEHMPFIGRTPEDQAVLGTKRFPELYSLDIDQLLQRYEVVCLTCRTNHEKETGTWRPKVQRSASRRRRELRGSSKSAPRRRSIRSEADSKKRSSTATLPSAGRETSTSSSSST